MHYFHHWRHVEALLNTYQGDEPLSRFLSNYFRKNKQMGGRDRKFAARYVYAFFRLGHALKELLIEERVSIADFLCNTEESPIAAHFLPPSCKEAWHFSLLEKIAMIQKEWIQFRLEDIFPHQTKLSADLSLAQWGARMLEKPNLFIRVIPERLSAIEQQLTLHNVEFEVLSDRCLSLPNATKLDGILKSEHYDVQDFSSQQTASYFSPSAYDYWWDCCAASGGKSLLLHSYCPTVKLLASDIRAQMLENLKERFYQSKVQKFQVKVLDMLENNKAQLSGYQFDGILVDAPCTGSGTWARTPENNVFFQVKNIEKFTYLQEKIVANALPYLKLGKPLVYITCSIFAEENERMVEKLLRNHSELKLEKAGLIDGTPFGADTLYAARLIKQ